MTIKSIGLLDFLFLVVNPRAQEREALAYLLIMRNNNKRDPRRQCGSLFERLQHTF